MGYERCRKMMSRCANGKGRKRLVVEWKGGFDGEGFCVRAVAAMDYKICCLLSSECPGEFR